MRLKLLSILMLAGLLLGMASTPGLAQDLQDTPAGVQQAGSVTVTPSTASASGAPGTVASYQLTVTNNTAAALALTVTTSNTFADFSAVVSPASFQVEAGLSQTVSVSVGISATASAANNNVTSVIFSDSTGQLGFATLTTTVTAPAPTETPPPTATPAPDGRPSIVLSSYGVTGDVIKPGQEFVLTMKVTNIGREYAESVTFTFGGTDFLPLGGGVTVLNEVDPKEEVTFKQRFIASSALSGSSVATLPVAVAYTSLSDGAAYTDSLTLTIRLDQPAYTGGSAGPTRTPTQVARPQLVVNSYQSSVDPLQPGATFELELSVQNLGTSDARSVTMVLGGGSTATDSSGTPVPGGEVSGSGSELSVFAPLGSSNLVYLGDIPQGTTITTKQKLIVNVTASPGAYSFKISFVYDDAKGARLVNDQVITMLIYQLPQVEIGFYRDAGMFFTGQMGMLPVQITNLGRKSSVLGNMTITAENADVTNNVSLVGALDSGGYYTLDANFIPYQSGPVDIQVAVNYTDDFNQSRTITQVLTVNVEEMPTPEVLPDDGSLNPGMEIPANETLWQKIVRAFKGLLGLDSSQNVGDGGGGAIDSGGVPSKEDMPLESEQPVEVVPVPKG